MEQKINVLVPNYIKFQNINKKISATTVRVYIYTCIYATHAHTKYTYALKKIVPT